MSGRAGLAAMALTVALVVAYAPAFHGAFLWDDVAHLPAPQLRTVAGLWQILLRPGASQQYYPLLFGTFWLEYRLWAEATLGYHLFNVAMHGLAAALVWLVLRRLAIPGALFAAAIFALHPVHVESVAWIAELKNTLSGVFYLASLLAYLRFDDGDVPRARRWWAASFVLFVCALLSKSVTGSLPGAVLVILWWKRGRLSWRRDVAPLVPFFVASAAIGRFTARYEAVVVGASRAGFTLSAAQRCLIAGRALWFYLWKLIWPVPLIFIYPRWHLDPTAWWQWTFPLAVIALFVALVLLQRRLGRGPLAASLFFAGTLLPALGVVDIYPFKFSFVADHFQYLASLGPIVLAAAGLTRWTARWNRTAAGALGVALLGILATLTWRQAHVYQSPETLWRATVEDNPDSFLAQIGLGVIYEDQGRHAEAIAAEERAVAIDPTSAEAHLNLARSYDAMGDYPRATALYEEGVRLESGYAPQVRPRLARLYVRLGQFDRGAATARTALRLSPGSSYLHAVLGLALEGQGRRAEAEQEWRLAIELEPQGEGARLARERLAAPVP